MASTQLLSQASMLHARQSDAHDPTHPLPNELKMEMPQEEIDAIIRNRRKARDPKACYACHRRKVKCDRGMPCDSCIKRDHPELCSYERPTKKRRLVIPTSMTSPDDSNSLTSPTFNKNADFVQQSGPNITIPKEQWERLNNQLHDLQESLKSYQGGNQSEAGPEDDTHPAGTISRSDESDKGGIHAPSGQMGTMHLGSRSVLAYMVGLNRSQSHQDAAKTLLEENVLPNLGLDNETTTYPFVDLWSTDASLHDMAGLVNALPGDDVCREFFRAYRDVACIIYPVVPDTAAFEITLEEVLTNRARMGGDLSTIDINRPFSVSTQWLALLFAVLASGSQSSTRLAKERELTSQVYICCSYQALRMSNFLTHPSLDVIQAFLIIGNVLSYNMNPGVSYILLGMTMRVAFSMGLQTENQAFSFQEQYVRSRIWWALAWQDSHFSVSYDRPSASALCNPEIPYRKMSTPGHRSYCESMFRIIKLTQEIIRERILNPRHTMTWSTIQSYKEEVARIVADGARHLRERAHCVSNIQHLERLALKLHSSYITSELCRPAIREFASVNASHNTTVTPAQSPIDKRRKSSVPGYHDTSSSVIAQLRRDCLHNLEGTIDAYVELYGISQFAARSWIGIQRAVSAAFLLGTMAETNQDPGIQKLLKSLEQVIDHRTREDPSFHDSAGGVDGPDALQRSSSNTKVPLAESPHWARSMTKSLKALSKLNATLAVPIARSPSGPRPLSAHRPGSQAYRPLPTPTTLSTTVPYQPTANGPPNGNAMQYKPVSLPMPNIPSIAMTMPSIIAPSMSSLGPGPGPGLGGAYPPIMDAYNSNSNSGWPNLQHAPITPDSSSSSGGEWNYGNIGERVKEFVQPALWG